MLTTNLPAGWVIAAGDLTNHTSFRALGYNASIGTSFEDVSNLSVASIPRPTTAQLMEVVSSNATDAGTVLSSGTSTGGSTSTIIDTGATFQTDGVAAGDIVLNDTDVEVGYVATVDSETQITMVSAADTTFASKVYRVVTAASTGISVVEVHGLDGNFDDLDEFIVTNGTTPVSSVGSYLRINNYHGMHAGTSGAAVGTIDLQDVGGGSVYNRITARDVNDLNCQRTVPNGFNMFLTDLSFNSSGTKPIQFRVVAEVDFDDREYIPNIFQTQEITIEASGGQHSNLPLPLRFPPKCTVKIKGVSIGGGGAIGTASFGYWLEPI